MLNKGFPFIKHANKSKRLQVCSERILWSNFTDRIGNLDIVDINKQKILLDSLRKDFVSQTCSLLRFSVKRMDEYARQRMKNFIRLRDLYTRFYQRSLIQKIGQPRYLVGGAIFCNSKSKSFEWERQKLSPAESRGYFDHIDQCHDIKEKTIICKQCNKRLR